MKLNTKVREGFEVGMFTALMMSLVAMTGQVSGCSHTVVRDSHVYKQELNFMSHAALLMGEQVLIQAKTLAESGDIQGCATLAKDALAVVIRVPHHEKLALHLADMGDLPTDTPEVPDENQWCLNHVLSGVGQ